MTNPGAGATITGSNTTPERTVESSSCWATTPIPAREAHQFSFKEHAENYARGVRAGPELHAPAKRGIAT
jgi:hypothetical protein